MAKTKIDWCDYVWNPVWGCLKYPPCKYCYARKIAKRFAKQVAEKQFKNFVIDETMSIYEVQKWKDKMKENLYYFLPTWLPENFKKSFPKEPSRIFVNSMSEIYFWEKEWMNAVLEKIKKYPQHTFMFLTKFPQVYKNYNFPKNCWLGITITDTTNADCFKCQSFHRYVKNNIKFISFEPLLKFDTCKFAIHCMSPPPDWIIVGAQTNPYKPPKREWVEGIIKSAKKLNVPIFLKDNLYKAYPDLPVLKEFPIKE